MLAELRAGVASALDGVGIKSADYTSPALRAPCAAVVPGEPYLSWGEDGVTFAAPVLVRYDVLLLTHREGSRKREAALIDEQIDQAVAALTELGEVTRVGQPGVLDVDGQKFVGSVISMHIATSSPGGA